MIFLFHELDRVLNKFFAKREIMNIVAAVLEVFLYDNSAFYHVSFIVKSVKLLYTSRRIVVLYRMSFDTVKRM